MEKSRFIELLAMRLDRSAGKEELDELDFIVAEYPHLKKTKQITEALDGKLAHDESFFDEQNLNNNLEDIWGKINGATEINLTAPKQRTTPFNYFNWVAAAAVIVLAITGFLFNKYFHPFKQTDTAYIKVVNVPFGKTTQLTLSDGTKVKLNAGSHFTYPSSFTDKLREVNLEGEGFFEVTKNKKKPFLVHTKRFTVKVLGTIFNVKAYKDDKSTETTLLKGKVQVEMLDDPEKKIILSPHEKLVLNNNISAKAKKQIKTSAATIKYEVDTLPDTGNELYAENAWTQNKIIFNNSELEDVTKQLSRKFDVQFIFVDDALRTEQISGILENENMETVLQILKKIIPFQSKTVGNKIYLSYK